MRTILLKRKRALKIERKKVTKKQGSKRGVRGEREEKEIKFEKTREYTNEWRNYGTGNALRHTFQRRLSQIKNCAEKFL